MKQSDDPTRVKIGGREIDLKRVAKDGCLHLGTLVAAAATLDR